jgi:hypothetical protein
METNISILNGRWCLNGKSISKSSFAKKCFFDKYIKLNLIKSPIKTLVSSFKNHAQEVKKKHNYIFKFKEQDFLKQYPNIENLTFTRKSD